MNPITITVNEDVVSKLQYLVDLHQRHDGRNSVGRVDELMGIVAANVADGSRCPSSWGRTMLERMGSVAGATNASSTAPAIGSPRTP